MTLALSVTPLMAFRHTCKIEWCEGHRVIAASQMCSITGTFVSAGSDHALFKKYKSILHKVNGKLSIFIVQCVNVLVRGLYGTEKYSEQCSENMQ